MINKCDLQKKHETLHGHKLKAFFHEYAAAVLLLEATEKNCQIIKDFDGSGVDCGPARISKTRNKKVLTSIII